MGWYDKHEWNIRKKRTPCFATLVNIFHFQALRMLKMLGKKQVSVVGRKHAEKMERFQSIKVLNVTNLRCLLRLTMSSTKRKIRQ